MRKATITIWGTPEESIEVKFQYEYRPVRKFFGERSTIFVNYVKVLEPLPFAPSDLAEDLYHAVAEDLGEHPQDVKVECDPEFTLKLKFIVEPKLNLESCFV
jgi:hypothetical protein